MNLDRYDDARRGYDEGYADAVAAIAKAMHWTGQDVARLIRETTPEAGAKILDALIPSV